MARTCVAISLHGDLWLGGVSSRHASKGLHLSVREPVRMAILTLRQLPSALKGSPPAASSREPAPGEGGSARDEWQLG